MLRISQNFLARFSPGSSKFWRQIWKSFGDFKAWLFVFGRKLYVLAIVTTSVVLRKVPKWWSAPNLAELLDNLRKKCVFTGIVQMGSPSNEGQVRFWIGKSVSNHQMFGNQFFCIHFMAWISIRKSDVLENFREPLSTVIGSICSCFLSHSTARGSCDNWSAKV